MPRFEVHYSFTCSKCHDPNDGRMDVLADDRLEAYQHSLDYIKCKTCRSALDKTQTFTTSTKEVK
jgi:hypothetical protein